MAKLKGFGVVLSVKSEEEWFKARNWKEAVEKAEKKFAKEYPGLEIEGADQVIDEDGEDIVWNGIEQ